MQSPRIDNLTATITAALKAAPANDLPGLAPVAAAFGHITPQVPDSPTCPETVQTLLVAARPLTATDLDDSLAAAIVAAADELHWYTPYPTHTEPDMVTLHQGYFVATITAPDDRGSPAVAATDDYAVFITIQAPNLSYPSHVHKAPELYHVIAGEADWEKGSLGFAPQPPGEWIVHPTGTRHAMRTNDQPLLALAIWTDDLESTPVIVRD